MKISDIKIGNKLIIGFSSVLLVAIVIGYIGYRGMNIIKAQHTEVSKHILPSVQSLLTISEAHTAIGASENLLLIANLTNELQKSTFEHFDLAKARADEAWKVYQPMIKSSEETIVWKEFVTAWNEWWKHHENFVALSKKYNADKLKINGRL